MLSPVQSSRESSEAVIEVLQVQATTLQHNNDSLMQCKTELSAALASVQDELRTTVETTTARINSLSTERTQLQFALGAVQEELRTAVAKTSDEIEALMNERASLSESKSRLEAKVGT